MTIKNEGAVRVPNINPEEMSFATLVAKLDRVLEGNELLKGEVSKLNKRVEVIEIKIDSLGKRVNYMQAEFSNFSSLSQTRFEVMVEEFHQIREHIGMVDKTN